MKKKIIALTLCVAMVAIAITGATLAYFTDTDQNTNEFTVGNVKIDLYETVGHKDEADNDKTVYDTKGTDDTEDDEELTTLTDLGKRDQDDENVKVNPNVKYDNIFPGDTMTKVATVENYGKNDAYIALVIKQEGYLNFNQKIDTYYENLDGYGEDAMQDIIDNVFPNWNLLYNKEDVAAPNAQVRYTMDANPANLVEDSKAEVLGVGYAQENLNGSGNPQYHYSGKYFTNGVRITEVPKDEPDFFTISDNGAHDRVWIVYLMVPAGEKFTMDLTTVCPSYFDSNSTNAFADMTLDVKAFAIQTAGFTSTDTDKQAELQKTAFAEALKPGFNF